MRKITNLKMIFLNIFKALVVYLFWLRTNSSQQIIASLFSIDQQDVSRLCSQVRNCLTKDFVPLYMGANQMTRERWLDHNSVLVKSLLFSDINSG